MMLVAKLPILYRSNLYEVGDKLPADNQSMVDAWVDAGSAVWKDEDEGKAKTPKAKSVTAPLGTEGISSDGDPKAKVGRLPDTPTRKTAPKKKGTSKK